MLRLLFLLPAFLLGCAAPAPFSSGEGTFAIEDVTVIDGTGAPARPHQTLVVERGRITALFPTGGQPLPPGVPVLREARGHTVMPGLIDAHVHLASSSAHDTTGELLRAAFFGGVTSVRDMGGSVARVQRFAAEARAAGAPRPRVFGSAVFVGPRWFATYSPARVAFWSDGHAPGTAPGVRVVTDTTDLARAVRRAKALGVRGIKVYADVAPALLARLVAEAHGAGLAVWAHGYASPSRPSDLVAAGVDVLSHEGFVWEAAVGTPLWNAPQRDSLVAGTRPDDARLARLFDAMRARGTFLEPTLFVMAMGSAEAETPAERDAARAFVRRVAAFVREAHRRGVPILAGTDALGRETPHVHAELQLLVREAGLTPLEAIQAATQHGARALGVADSLGTLEVGKLADLIVLRESPAEDVRNTQTVAWVVRGGHVHRRTDAWEVPVLAEAPLR